MGNAPCKDCTDRIVGCHSYCDKYLKFAKERDRVCKIRNNEIQMDTYFIDRISETNEKYWRRVRKKGIR